MMLNEFTQLTGYNRSYLTRTLRKKKILGYLAIGNKRIKYVAGDKGRKKRRYYDHDILIALKELWEGVDFIYSNPRDLPHTWKNTLPYLRNLRKFDLPPDNPDTMLRQFL